MKLSPLICIASLLGVSTHFAEGAQLRHLKAGKSAKSSKTLKAALGPYPGYPGPLNVKGDIAVSFDANDILSFKFDIEGVEADCGGCGIHIHTGTTCDNAVLVEGHYYDAASVPADPWVKRLNANSAVYYSDASGKAKGEFTVDSGYGYVENDGHAVVVHDSDSARVGCGVLA